MGNWSFEETTITAASPSSAMRVLSVLCRRYPSNHIHVKRALSVARKPLMLLDVDGVINFLNPECIWPDTKEANVNGGNGNTYTIRWSPEVVNKINLWSSSSACEIRWLTTWDNNARLHLAKNLGINDFELARDPAKKLSKKQAAELCIKEDTDRPLIWIDDDLDQFLLTLDFMERDKQLLIQPSIIRGLTPYLLNCIETFIKNPIDSAYIADPRRR